MECLFYSNAKLIEVNGNTGHDGSNCNDADMQSEAAL